MLAGASGDLLQDRAVSDCHVSKQRKGLDAVASSSRRTRIADHLLTMEVSGRHARTRAILATQFFLQIGPNELSKMRRKGRACRF